MKHKTVRTVLFNHSLPFILFSMLCLLWPADFCAQPLEYRIRMVHLAGKPQLQVTIRFNGAPGGLSFLSYRDNQFGEAGQMAYVDVPAQAPGITMTKVPDSNRLEIRHAPGARVEATYLVSDLQGERPFFQYCCYAPIIQPAYFHVQAGHLLAPPSDYWSDSYDVKPVRIIWEDFPADWTLHHSFGAARVHQVDLTANQFGYGVFTGGDFRRHTFEVRGRSVHFVTRGKWRQFSDDTLTQLLRRTVEGHRTFWRDDSDTIFSVSFIPIDDAPWSEQSRFASCGGSGLTNSFMSFATNNPGIDYDNIRYLYVHELMHHWIGGKIENASEERQYWFSEGFTEYYTLKNSLRYGLITVNQFINQFNADFLAPHYSSPVCEAPNDSLNYTRFWTGGKAWEKLPYQRGCLFAFYLDNLIRQRSKGRHNLDELMRNILDAVEKKPSQKLDHPFFRSMLSRYAGKAGKKAFDQYIEEGRPIDFTTAPLPAGFRVVLLDLPPANNFERPTSAPQTLLKNIPQLQREPSMSDQALKAALLK